MYMRGTREQAATATLDGFNPLKAIGRALGGAGRAIVGAVIPGVGPAVSAVLDVAAKSPKGSGPAIAQALTQATQPQPTTLAPPAPTTAPQPPPTSDPMKTFMEQMSLFKMMQGPQPAPTQQPLIIPGGGGAPSVVVSSPGGAPQAAAASPPWLIPAAIGAVGLMFVLSQKKGR